MFTTFDTFTRFAVSRRLADYSGRTQTSTVCLTRFKGAPASMHETTRRTSLSSRLILASFYNVLMHCLCYFKVSIWSRGVLWFWYLYQAGISIQQFFFFIPASFSPRNQASKFAVRPRPSRLAEFLGLVTDDVKIKILASKTSCLHEFPVLNHSVFLGYRYLVQI